MQQFNLKNMEIGQRLMEFREGLGLSQPAFAAKCGLTQQAIWRIEKGETNPRTSTLNEICKAYGLSLAWLKSGEGEQFGFVSSEPNWKEEAYSQQQSRIDELTGEVEWLRSLITKITGQPSFPNGIDPAGTLNSPLNVVRVAA